LTRTGSHNQRNTVARNHSNARSLKGFCRGIALSLAKATYYAENGRRFEHRDGQRPVTILSESANGALLQDKEYSASLLGLKKQMPSTAVQYIAVFLKRLEAGIRELFEKVDLGKETYIEHICRP
jgi:hypothetical protein